MAGALLAALVPWTLRSDRITSALARQIKQGYGIALTSSSQLTLTLLPLPQLVLSGVRLTSPDGVLQAEADELRSQLRLFPILQGRLRLHKVQMERGRITLTLSEKPTPTVEGSLSRLRERLGAGVDSRWTPRIDRFVLTDGEVVVRERAGSREVTRLLRASMILNSPEPDGDLDLTAAGEWNGERIVAQLGGLNLAAIRTGSASKVGGEITTPLGRGTISGSLTWSDHPSFKGAVRAQSASLARLVGWTGIGGDAGAVARPVSLIADGTVDFDRIEWPRASFDIGTEHVDGAIAVQFGARPQLRATLAAEDLDLGWLGRLFDARTAGPPDADYDVRLSSSALAFGGVRLQDAAVSVQSNAKGIEASLGRAGFAGGSLRGRISAGWDLQREWRVAAFAERLDLEKVLAEFGDSRSATGIAGGQVALEALGDRSTPLARQVRGRVSLTVRDGDVGGILQGDAAKRAPPVALPSDWRAGRLRFNLATLNLDLGEGRANIAQGTIEASGTRSLITGHVDLDPPNAALRLTTPPASGLNRPAFVLDVVGPLQRLNLGLGEAAAR